MPARKSNPSAPRSKLAWYRLRAGLTQAEVADLTGIPLATYRKLERGQIKNPGVQMLANAAFIVGAPLAQILEPRYLRWGVFSPTRKRPPHALTIRMKRQPGRWPIPKEPKPLY